MNKLALQAQIDLLTHQLQLLHKDCNDFVNIAAHDLKEPVRSMHHYALFLTEDYSDKLDEDGRHMLQALMHEADRLNGLIQSLVHYAKISAAELKIETVNIHELVHNTLDTMDPPLQPPAVLLNVDESLPTIRGDATLLRQVFSCLLDNARKYNLDSNKQLEIGTVPSLPQPCFYVKDNGIGIDEKNFEIIFLIFRTAHDPKQFNLSSGVGLTIAKKIIQKHGGQIWLKSQLGIGSCFYFTIPQD